MTTNVPISDEVERIVILSVDSLRWDYHDQYRNLYPPGVWYRATTQATGSNSHASLFTGVNTPRHRAFEWGDEVAVDHVFQKTDSQNLAKVGIEDGTLCGGDDGNTTFVDVLEWCDGSSDGNEAVVARIDTETDLLFFQDWLPRLSGPGRSATQRETISEDASPKENHRRYRTHVERSLAVQRTFLNMLKECGLYENTLFVLVGDHGQALGEPPFHEVGHGHYPEDAVCRVPLAFCSPAFDSRDVDTETNPRLVDVMPTLLSFMDAAGIPFEEFTHRFEGVDLTEFDGELAAYCTGANTHANGDTDGITTADHSFIVKPESVLSARSDQGYQLQQRVDNPILESKLETLYRTVREGPDSLIYRQLPNREFLEEMGYLCP